VSASRRVILIGYLLAVTLACTWVPWQRRYSPNVTEFDGYGWIWTGPDFRNDEAPQTSKETSQASAAAPVAQNRSASDDWVDNLLKEAEHEKREEAIQLNEAERKAHEETIQQEQKLAAIDRERLAVEFAALSAVFGVLFLVTSALRVLEPESSMVKSAESGPVQQICEARSPETVSVARISEEPQVTTSQAKGQESVGPHDTKYDGSDL